MPQDIPDKDLFMMCASVCTDAFSALPSGYTIRTCRPDEYDAWKWLHVDDSSDYDEYNEVLEGYFNDVYKPQGDLFFHQCQVICDKADKPVGTCFLWKAYGAFNTIHWLKVKKGYEGRGLGRALLTHVMAELPPQGYPVYLHTHPSAYRAIKLYSDFGFHLLKDAQMGNRRNDLKDCMPILKEYMPAEDYARLRTTKAPDSFLRLLDHQTREEF